jgi:hypothetical protein
MLAALPWFRQGWMPSAWRTDLLARQNKKDRDITHAALAGLVYSMLQSDTADENGRVTVACALPAPRKFFRDWDAWRNGLPMGLTERDPLFGEFLSERSKPTSYWLMAATITLAVAAVGFEVGSLLPFGSEPHIQQNHATDVGEASAENIVPQKTIAARSIAPYQTAGQAIPLSTGITAKSDTDRPGGDYDSVNIGDLLSCQKLCAEQTRCKAYTFVPPGYTWKYTKWRGPSPRCWLKERATNEIRTPGMTSGIRELVTGR